MPGNSHCIYVSFYALVSKKHFNLVEFFSSSATANLEQYGEVDSFLGQPSSSQQPGQSPFQLTTKESSGIGQGKNQNSPFFTMSSLSSSSGHEDFLSPATTTQTQSATDTFSGPQAPTAKVITGSQTPLRSSASPPQSFPPPTASWLQSPSQSTISPQTPPVPSSSLPQTPPQPGTSWPQTPPQTGAGWPQTTPTTSSVSQSTVPSSMPYTSPQPSSQHNLSPSQQVQSGTPPVVTPVKTEPVQPHWFYRKGRSVWLPFSYIDSDCLEQALKTSSASGDRIVATDGGRYDVNLDKRLRYPLYWEEGVSVVRRCTWFYKGDGESKLVPYMEDMAARLEVWCIRLYSVDFLGL